MAATEYTKFTAQQIAQFFISKANESGEVMSLMKLLKLVYIAQGVHLVRSNGLPLFEDRICAWTYGPVVENLYHLYKRFGNGHIFDSEPLSVEVSNDTKVMYELQSVWKTFGKWTAIKLSNWTHEKDSPWDIVWNKQKGNAIKSAPIPNQIILNYFVKFVKKEDGSTSE
ncbi:MAG: type II toxin-antitoxin system antitoxin SocA domain-containing protein [Bacteroidota bacterium]